MGGFECSTHLRTPQGPRLDLIAATRHDLFARRDYAALSRLNIKTARDGIRWHRVEKQEGDFDFSPDLPMIRAAAEHGIQVIWDVCHYGWPDDLSPFDSVFSSRLAALATSFVDLLTREGVAVPIITPINEISFLAWIGGNMGWFPPFAADRAEELNRCLVKATINCIRAIREAAPQTRICAVDPLIHVVGRRGAAVSCQEAAAYRRCQFDAWDMIAGARAPELEGKPEYLDIIGVNYYVHNQWRLGDDPAAPCVVVKRCDPDHRPLADMLEEVFHRYGRPVFVAETGIEDSRRPAWLRHVAEEARAAISRHVPVEGICIYPITDYPGWADDRNCSCGLLSAADEDGRRQIYKPLRNELRRQQMLMMDIDFPPTQSHNSPIFSQG